jgi:hypothetical protein
MAIFRVRNLLIQVLPRECNVDSRTDILCRDNSARADVICLDDSGGPCSGGDCDVGDSTGDGGDCDVGIRPWGAGIRAEGVTTGPIRAGAVTAGPILVALPSFARLVCGPRSYIAFPW